MNKKTLILTSVTMLVILTTSMIATAHAWKGPKKEFVSYDLIQIMGPGETTYVDASGAPELVIIESTETAIEISITIDGQVYTYPEDFDYEGKSRIEFNAITGEGIASVEKTFIFNWPGKPILKSWVTLRITGLSQPTDPENIHSQGVFTLTGTRRFGSVEGFGLVEDLHHFGFIKGWSSP